MRAIIDLEYDVIKKNFDRRFDLFKDGAILKYSNRIFFRNSSVGSYATTIDHEMKKTDYEEYGLYYSSTDIGLFEYIVNKDAYDRN